MTTPGSPSPEEETRLRRLLASARADRATPPEVVARLDATLAELSAERSAGAEGDVTSLADGAQRRHHHRRRTLAGLLAAAAIVVVAGVGIEQIAQSGGADQTSSADLDAGEAARDRDPTASAEADAADGTEESLDDAQAIPEAADAPAQQPGPPVGLKVHPTDDEAPLIRVRLLTDDALAVRNALPGSVAAHWQEDAAPLLFSPADFECASAPWGAGVLVGVRYDGGPAVLAFRAPTNQNQVAEVLQCATADVVRSVTLPAP